MLHKALLLNLLGIDRTKFWVVEFKLTSEIKPGKQTLFIFPKDSPKSFKEMYPEIDINTYWEPVNPDKYLRSWKVEGSYSTFYPYEKITRDLVLEPVLYNYIPSSGSATIDFTFGVYESPGTRYHGYGGYGSMNASYRISNSPLRIDITGFMAQSIKQANNSVALQLSINFSIKGDVITRHPTIFSLSPLVTTDSGELNSKIPSQLSWENPAKSTNLYFETRLGTTIGGYRQCNITSGTRYVFSWHPK